MHTFGKNVYIYAYTWKKKKRADTEVAQYVSVNYKRSKKF